jgi:hypothetical protein
MDSGSIREKVPQNLFTVSPHPFAYPSSFLRKQETSGFSLENPTTLDPGLRWNDISYGVT